MIHASEKKFWAIPAPDLYPEIDFERTLGKVILEIIASFGREATLRDEAKAVFSARFSKDRRAIEFSTWCAKRIFISSVSMRGVHIANLLSSDLREVARAVESWLLDQCTLLEMKAKVPTLEVSELSLETKAGRGVEARWNCLLHSVPEYSDAQKGWFDPAFCALVRAAATRPRLRQLVPVVSLSGCILSFSRTLGYPYVVAADCGIWAAGGRCAELKNGGGRLAQGEIGEMLDFIERALPYDTEPAIFGTAEDLAP